MKNNLNFENIPFDCSPALNLIGVHPQLISLARDVSRQDVRIYQSQAWAKFSGETDFEQFSIVIMGIILLLYLQKITQNSITFLVYFSDVSEEHGPAHYVTRTDSEKIDKISENYR